jgi:hypothetical protein
LILFLQIIQLILFFIPVGALLALGVLFLSRSVVILNRRWYLFVFIPLIFANPFALIENNVVNGISVIGDWRFWLVVVVDIILMAGGTFLFRGFHVIGLNASESMAVLKDLCEKKYDVVNLHMGEKQTFWGETRKAMILTIEDQEKHWTVWVMEKQGEVQLQADSGESTDLIKQVVPILRKIRKAYVFNDHVLGVLFIVFAVVLAVFGWIFFFEPRLVLID